MKQVQIPGFPCRAPSRFQYNQAVARFYLAQIRKILNHEKRS